MKGAWAGQVQPESATASGETGAVGTPAIGDCNANSSVAAQNIQRHRAEWGCVVERPGLNPGCTAEIDGALGTSGGRPARKG